MADAPVVHIGENSPEQVALKLFEIIARVEKKTLSAHPHDGWEQANRNYILTTYAQALRAVRQPFAKIE